MKHVTLKDSLFFYLARLRLGLSIKKLVALIPICTKSQAYRLVEKIRVILIEKFVNKHLGFDHITRGEINIRHTTTLSKELFDSNEESVILVWDGTYVYIEKSSNYSFGKHTYSQHKNLHLLKMMMCTTTTGYIVETFGPYLANGANNDANIMKDIFDDENHIRKFFKMEDIFIVDRGFRDSLDFLNSLGVETQT